METSNQVVPLRLSVAPDLPPLLRVEFGGSTTQMHII